MTLQTVKLSARPFVTKNYVAAKGSSLKANACRASQPRSPINNTERYNEALSEVMLGWRVRDSYWDLLWYNTSLLLKLCTHKNPGYHNKVRTTSISKQSFRSVPAPCVVSATWSSLIVQYGEVMEENTKKKQIQANTYYVKRRMLTSWISHELINNTEN